MVWAEESGIQVRSKHVDMYECSSMHVQNHMQKDRFLKFRSIMDAVNWVCDDALDEHVWVSELAISCEEARRDIQ